MWLRNCWQVIAFAREIGNTPLARTVCGEEIVLFRTAVGQGGGARRPLPAPVRAAVARARQSASRSSAAITGCASTREGQCVRVPGQDTVPRQAQVRSYPLVERHTFAWIWLGDAALADPGKIPDVHWCDHPAWAVADGYHHFGANYQLVNDNLLDLSHESFVHEDTIGNEAVAEAPFTVNLDGDTRAHAPRHVRHGGAAVLQAHHRLHRPHRPLAHQHVLAARACTSSRTARCRPAPRTRAPRSSARCSTSSRRRRRTTTHYFWAIVRQFKIDDQALTDYIRDGIAKTFDQDKAVLEAQQRIIGGDPDRAVFPVSIRVDAGADPGPQAVGVDAGGEAQRPRQRAGLPAPAWRRSAVRR